MRQNAFVVYGRIVVPSGFPGGRDGYVRYCLDTNTVSILTDRGEYKANCPVLMPYAGEDDGVAFSLDYPANEDVLGGTVVAIKLTRTSVPVVIGMASYKGARFRLDEEKQVVISRISDDGNGSTSSFRIEGLGRSGRVNISANSTEQDGGRIRFTARNGHDTGALEFRSDIYEAFVSGDMTEEVGNDYLLHVFNDHGITVDGDGAWTFGGDWKAHADGDAEIDGAEVRIGSGATQWAVKGEDLVSLMGDWIDVNMDTIQTLSSATVLTSMGPASFDPAVITQLQLQNAQLQVLHTQMMQLLSQKVKIE